MSGGAQPMNPLGLVKLIACYAVFFFPALEFIDIFKIV